VAENACHYDAANVCSAAGHDALARSAGRNRRRLDSRYGYLQNRNKETVKVVCGSLNPGPKARLVLAGKEKARSGDERAFFMQY
jgi:hypothetical protein